MEDLQRQWNDIRKFTPRLPTWAAVSKTHVFRIRNLLLKWRRKATATDARQPKITQWLSTTARDPDSARGAANRLVTQQTKAVKREARAPRSRRRALCVVNQPHGCAAKHDATAGGARRSQRRLNDADQTPPEDDLQPESDALGPATGTALEGTTAGIGHAAEANGAPKADIDLGWLPELGLTSSASAAVRRVTKPGVAPATCHRSDASF